jgi:phage head maturation protease
MSEIVTKTAAVVENAETDNPNGAFEVILSAATLDRDGEVIDARAFDPLPDHIPFDIDHGMTVTTTVGSGAPYYAEDGSLRVKGTYASTALAQEVRTLVSEGHVRTTSVTFMAADRQPDSKGIDHVVKAELLNGTFTPIPSNREAVVLSSKSLTALTEKIGARNSSKDAEAIQAMHDASVSLGALCSEKSHTHADEKTTEAEAPAEPAEVDPEVSDTEQSADEDASDPAAVEDAGTDAAKSADEGSVMSARLALAELEARLELGG